MALFKKQLRQQKAKSSISKEKKTKRNLPRSEDSNNKEKRIRKKMKK